MFWFLPEEDIKTKTTLNQILTIEVILINIIFLAFCYLINQRLKRKYIEWDHKTTTISDYTVKFEIPEELYEKYIDYIYDLNESEFSNESRVFAFK